MSHPHEILSSRFVGDCHRELIFISIEMPGTLHFVAQNLQVRFTFGVLANSPGVMGTVGTFIRLSTFALLLLAATAVSVQSDDAPITLGPSCVTADCHGDLAPGANIHGPLNVGNCEICHETIDERHEFRLARSGPDLCGLCHVLTLNNIVHTPVRDGDCTGCHDPHRSDVQPFLKESPTSGLCMQCHDEGSVMDHEVLHGPVASGLCVLCHEAHSSANLHLVRSGGEDLCLTCHGDEFEAIFNMRHTHPPLNDGTCLNCHDPHGGDTHSLTHVPPPELCNTCHTEIETLIETSTNVHAPVMEGRACSECHSAHASSLDHLLTQTEIDLCLECHDREIETESGEVIPDVQAIIGMSTYLHGPVREGSCSPCHQPHASDTFGLLVYEYPPEFYAPYESDRYALCFQCHSESSFIDAETDTLTNFRDDESNLHYVHVSRETRGRSCRACHEVHASNQPFHMSESVPYGGWDMPINYEQLSDGGRCSPGCHSPQEYHRTPAEITPSNPTAE